MLKNKTLIAIYASILMLTIAIPFATLPSADAQSNREITSYAYMIAVPNPVGVGQNTYISIWVDASLPNAVETNDIRRHGYTLTITKPDGTVANTVNWPIIYDTTGVAFTAFTPEVEGTYTIKFDYAGQVYTWNSTAAERTWTGSVFKPASRTITLTVQQEPLPAPINSYPLPTEYWSRPIEGQNLDWWTISSHWLRASHFGTFQIPGDRLNLWQRDGAAPNTGHIMWTKPVEFGGVVGGSNVVVDGATHYSGGSYEGRFGDALIMHGRLYFSLPLGHAGTGGGYVCMDLRTGEQLWYRDDIGIIGSVGPSKGQLYSFDTENQHGVGGGILWRVVGTTWTAYDAFTGMWLYNLTGVPTGTEVYTEKGEIVRYVFNYAGRWMALWNFSEASGARGGAAGFSINQWRPNGKSIDTSNAYTWNVTIPNLHGLANPSIIYILPGDLIIGTSSSVTTGTYGMANRGMSNPWTVWAISDRPNSRGQLLWIKNYTAPAGDIGLTFGPLDPVNRVWTMAEAETMQWLGFSVDNGDKLWGPTNTPVSDMQFFSSGSGAGQRAVTAYGNIYTQGYGGEIFAYNTKDGQLLWKYNNTDGGLQTPWGLMPTLIAAIADGKVYLFNNEHSPNSPLYRGYKVYCVDAYTGEEIWTLPGWAGTIGGHGVSTSVLAEGFLVYYNFYDNSVYSVGKGPSSVMVEAPMSALTLGSKLIIRGSVNDISPGTKQHEQATRFPNGVPAVSDESQNAWMQYVYMQKPMPRDVVGVPVTINVIDANGNYRNIGTTTSDASGFFSFEWKPDIEGKYTVVASFAGSGSYYPSSAQTAFVVEEASSQPTEQPALTLPPTEMYIIGSTVAIIIAIAIVGLLLLRRRP